MHVGHYFSWAIFLPTGTWEKREKEGEKKGKKKGKKEKEKGKIAFCVSLPVVCLTRVRSQQGFLLFCPATTEKTEDHDHATHRAVASKEMSKQSCCLSSTR